MVMKVICQDVTMSVNCIMVEITNGREKKKKKSIMLELEILIMLTSTSHFLLRQNSTKYNSFTCCTSVCYRQYREIL